MPNKIALERPTLTCRSLFCCARLLAYKTYSFDSNDGKITSVLPYSEKERSNHIKGWIYTLHVGSWAGWITKIFYLLSVIIGAILPITGYYLWIKRLIIKRKHH
ncbi:MAG: PepSY domain-containing protein [Candidatus Egerieousia sp.]